VIPGIFGVHKKGRKSGFALTLTKYINTLLRAPTRPRAREDANGQETPCQTGRIYAFTRIRTRRDYGVKYVMFGLCDVKKCSEPTFMGWRPLTEPRGRQICEYHWLRHWDEKDGFDLYDEFKFRRPARIRKPVVKSLVQKDVPRFRHRLDTLCCRQCGEGRKPGHTYCSKCSQSRYRQANQKRQRRHRMKRRPGMAVA
jgi:hypothetical protein